MSTKGTFTMSQAGAPSTLAAHDAPGDSRLDDGTKGALRR